MDPMVVVVVAAVLVVGAVVGRVAWARRGSRKTPFLTATPDGGYGSRGLQVADGPPRSSPHLELWRLAPSTALRVRGERFVVLGTITFTEGGTTWVEHLLEADGPGPRRYLSFAEGELVLWTLAPEVVVTPGAPRVQVDGVEYIAIEHGQARYRSAGVTGVRRSGRVRYHDYIAGDDSRLAFEDFDRTGLWECSRGQFLAPSDIVPARADTPAA